MTQEIENNSTQRLTVVPSGRTVRIVKIEGGQGIRSRLAALGMMAGVEIRVVRNDRRGPFIVEVKGSRVILGRGMLDSICVDG